MYADNPELMELACKDTGWDEEVLKQRISTLTADSDQDDYVVEKDLHISRSIAGHLMNEYINVRITVDSEITSYNGRELGSQEVCYTNVGIDSSIKVTATGSQTEVGESTNTYDIDWGNANPNNFVLSEDLGTLTVIESSTPEPTPSPGPTSTPDPTPTPKPSPSPKPNPTPTPEPIPTPLPIPTPTPKPTSAPIPTPETIYSNKVTFIANSDNKIYDGTALSCDEVKVEGLPKGFTYTVSVSDSQTDVGTSKNTIKSYKIFDATDNDVTSKFTNIQVVEGVLQVNPLEVTVVTEGASKTYDGTELTNVRGYVEGLPKAEEGIATVTCTGAITDAGSTDNTYRIDWGTLKESNYTVKESLKKLKIDPLKVYFDLGLGEDFSFEYWGRPNCLEWFDAYYEKEEENHFEGDISYLRDDDENMLATIGEFELRGGGKVRLTFDGFTDAGKYILIPTVSFEAGKAGNYALNYVNNTMNVDAFEVTIDLGIEDETCILGEDPYIVDGFSAYYGYTSYEVAIELLEENDVVYAIAGTFKIGDIAEIELIFDGITEKGIYTITPSKVVFKKGNEKNIQLEYTKNSVEFVNAIDVIS